MTAGAMQRPAAALHEYLPYASSPEQKTSVVPAAQRRLPVQPSASQSVQPAIELEDVEMTSVPLMVYFKILVRPPAQKAHAHHVMKTFRDLQDLDEALSRELGGGLLPKLPQGRTPKELTETSFCARLGAYLASLAASPFAVETYSFKNFFQLSDEYQRWLPQSTLSSGLGFGVTDEAKWPASPSAAVPPVRLPAASSSSTASATTQLPGAYRTGSSDLLLSSRSQPADRTFLIADGSPLRPQSRSQQEAPRGVLLRPAAATVPRAPDMPQTAPDMPQASPSQEVQAMQSVGSRNSLPAGVPAAPSADFSAEAGSPQRAANVTLSQSYSSDEHGGSSVETSAGGKKHRRRRPWCVVCMANPQEVAIDPCGHLSMCHRCATAVQACPVCRGPIEKALRVYIA